MANVGHSINYVLKRFKTRVKLFSIRHQTKLRRQTKHLKPMLLCEQTHNTVFTFDSITKCWLSHEHRRWYEIKVHMGIQIWLDPLTKIPYEIKQIIELMFCWIMYRGSSNRWL